MKPKAGVPGKRAGRSGSSLWRSQLPMEWMDPLSWRLPSGKALAEFALQTGFLAPLMLGTPKVKRKKPAQAPPAGTAESPGSMLQPHMKEGPDASGAFRETR